MSFLKNFFSKFKLPSPMPKAPPPRLTVEQVSAGIPALRYMVSLFDSRALANFAPISHISPVQCPEPFGGWGYVEGRTEGVRVDDRITLVAGDSDMDFTSVCVLVDSLPCLILTLSGKFFGVKIIRRRDYVQEVLHPSTISLSTWDAVPDPVKIVLESAIRFSVKRFEASQSGTAIEKLLDYSL